MSLNAIRENKILAKISKFSVLEHMLSPFKPNVLAAIPYQQDEPISNFRDAVWYFSFFPKILEHSVSNIGELLGETRKLVQSKVNTRIKISAYI